MPIVFDLSTGRKQWLWVAFYEGSDVTKQTPLSPTCYKSANFVLDRADIRSVLQRRVDSPPNFPDDQNVILAFCVDEITSFKNNIIPRYGLIWVSVIRQFIVLREEKNPGATTGDGLLNLLQDAAPRGKIRLPVKYCCTDISSKEPF
jgi:hypothetical protein